MKALSKTLFGLLLLVLAACNNVDTGGERFTIDITGDLSGQIKPTSAVSASMVKDEITLEPTVTRTLSFITEDGKRIFSVFFYGPEAPKVGTYNLVSGPNTAADRVTAVLFDNGSFDPRAGLLQSFTTENGTLTLTKAGETYSGSVEVILKGPKVGTFKQKIVTVKGTFDGIQ